MRLAAGWQALKGLSGRRTVGSVTVASLMATAVVVAAVQSDGTEATNVQLNDGSVWVSNGADQRVGRLNLQIRELDFSIYSSASPDVLQEYRTVILPGREAGVQRLDVLSGSVAGSNEIPLTDYRLGGGVGALLDRESGFLWVGPGQQIVAPDYPDEPDALVEPGSWLLVTGAVPTVGAGDGAGDGAAGGPDRGRVIVVDDDGWREVLLGDDLEPLRAVPDDADGDASDPGDDAASTTTTTTVTAPLGDGEAGDVPFVEPAPLRPATVTPLGVLTDEIAEVSAVGGTPVVLLLDGTVVLANGTPIEVPGDVHRLQQVGPNAGAVLVASDDGVFAVDLETGEVERLATAGAAPAAPVRVGNCVRAAWSGEQPTYFRRCNDEASEPFVIPGAAPDAELVFRVNGPNVALNSTGDGDIWADHDGTLAYIGNWDEVEPQSEDAEDVQETTGESRTVIEKQCIEGGAEVPIAGDDQLGVRPRQSIIDVLNNDDDVNCEPIAIGSLEPAADWWGQLTVIDNGQHILYSPSDEMLDRAADQIESFQFTYVATDIGGNESSPATVTVAVKEYGLGNSAPALRPKGDDTTREMKTVVEEGRSVSYNVLSDWWDPDGDDLRLVTATPQGDGEVAATADGLVRYTAAGVAPGIYSVDVVVSDGIDSNTEVLEVTVKPVGSPIPPVTANDFITLTVGGTGRVAPLANDSDPNESELTMRPLWTEAADPGYTTEIEGDEVEITANAAGVYALEYEASDGTESTEGTIRLEVLEPNEQNEGPIAVPDQVKLRPHRVVNVDVLDNDVDPDGDLLAVVDVDVASSDTSLGIARASLVDRRMVQVEVVPGPDGETPVGPFVVHYTITDGYSDQRVAAGQSTAASIAESERARGAITVLVQPPSEDQPPVLTDDAAIVRSGDVASVHVLRNDTDPDSDRIELVSVDEARAAELEAAGEGVVWVNGREVYFQGGAPGRYSVLYTVEAAGKRASAEVVFVVTALPDAETNPNQPPSPPDLVVRAIRGGTVRVNVPWSGADPDGDSVRLLDTLGAPAGAGSGNRVVLDPENPGTILYTAGANSAPRDEFTYTVRDRYGLTATGTVTVMVVDDGGWAPQAHDDVMVGKPGRVLSVPVVANDSSPQDRQLEMAAEPFFDLDGQPSTSPVNPEYVRLLDQQDPATRGRIEVEVPTTTATLVEHYRITDGFNPSDAYVRVSADPNAPNMPPIAEDDEVTDAEVRGLTEVTVDVVANDIDPDDASSPLVLDLPAGQPGRLEAGRLVVPLNEFSQTVLYRITDSDGASTVGVVKVPGLENHPPVLSEVGKDPTTRIIEASSPEPLEILLSDIVEDPDDDPVIVLTDTEIRNVTGIGADLFRRDDGTGFTYVPPGELTETAFVSIAFEVTDRPNKTPDERQEPLCNCLSQLTVDLVIEASSPPRVVSQGSVQVPQLDEPTQLDLTPHVVDDQGDPLTYELDPSTFDGLTIEHDGPSVTITSELAGDAKIPIGRQIDVRYSVSDGNFEPVDNTFTVTIKATNKGQPSAGTFPTFEAERDTSFSLPNLVDAAVNPFAADGRALTLLNPTVDAPASISCSESGSCEFFSDTVGTFTVTYTLRDAVDQTATGTLDVVVKGLPRAPGAPVEESVGDHEVTLSWTAADDQGAPITAYHVTVVETGAQHTFTTTGGVVDGLENAQAYHFTVVAENELGRGEVSSPSSGMIPDRVPDPPEGMTFTDYQDQQLTLRWEPPSTAGDFSAITQYRVQIGGQTFEVGGGVTSLVVGLGGDGPPLINGTDYTFRVQAQNSATTNDGWGAWSPQSATTQRPSRHPDPPTGVAATNSGDGGTPRLTVTWNAPAFDGGRELIEYRVCRNDAVCQTISASLTTATFDQSRAQESTFTVVAINTDKNRAESDASASSAPVVSVGDPDPPVIDSVASGDHTLSVSFTPRNNSGCNSATTEFSIDGGGTWQANTTFSGLTNGQQYTVVGRTVLAASCGTAGVVYRSVASNAVSQTPYGPLVQPSISASGGGTTTITWNWRTNRADDGRPGWQATLSGDCGSQTLSSAPGASGSTSQSYLRDGSTRSCTITVVANGQAPLTASASAQVQDPPPPSINSWNVSVNSSGQVSRTASISWYEDSTFGGVTCRFIRDGSTEHGPVNCGQSPSYTTNGPGGTHSYRLEVCQPRTGLCATSATRTVNNNQGPYGPASISLSHSSEPYNPTGCSGSCVRVNVSGSNFTPNSTVRVYCDSFGPYNLSTTNGSGSFGPVGSTCADRPGGLTLTVRVVDSSGKQATSSIT